MSIPGYAFGYEEFAGRIERTTAGATPDWGKSVQASEDAPNIILIVADDLGFSDIAPYGSEIDTPNLEKLAQAGVQMTNYHTAPMCSPARASLLTGVNPHKAGFGFVSNVDPGFPGMRVEFGDKIDTLPSILRSAGYATMAYGKWHLVREANMHEGADKSSWPCQQGFDHYYGTLEGLNSFFEPNQLVQDNTVLDIEEWPDDYYITDDLTEKACSQILSLRASNPKKPFFCYFAHTAVHAPLQAPVELLEGQRGKYAEGWDKLRELRFQNQLDRGLFPPGTRQAPRNDSPGYDVSPWEDHSPLEQERFARYMEAYAALVQTIDQSLGRLTALLEQMGELENTIIVFTSDNGASAEGDREGTRTYFRMFPATLSEFGWQGDTELELDSIGTRDANAHYPRGWAQTSNTPFRYYKGQTFAGGVRVPFIVSWPKKSETLQGLRSQYSYVTDVVPTLLDLLGLEHPNSTGETDKMSPDGTSVAPVWESAKAVSAHKIQYSEISGHRGLYKDGWKLLSLYNRADPVDEPKWQLFDVENDPTELDDVADQHPDVVEELAKLWDSEGWKNTVFPLIEGSGPGAKVLPGRRPADSYLIDEVTIYPGTPVMERYRSLELIQYRNFQVMVRMASSSKGDEGVLVSHGDSMGGYMLYVEGGTLWFAYNAYGEPLIADVGAWDDSIREIVLTAVVEDPLMWTFKVGINGEDEKIVLSRVPQMTGMVPWTGISVGRDARGPVLRDLRERKGTFTWNGTLESVTYRPGKQQTVSALREKIHLQAHRQAD